MADPWLAAPLDAVLKDAAVLLGQEDSMLPTAFRLLDRLKMPAPGDDAGGCSRLLRLIGRYVGYHSAVVEQVLEALSLSEHPSAVIEVLPLLVVGAGPKEVARVAESLQVALNEDLTGLLLPVLAALFDLPLPAKLRREALQLARDSLAVVQDQDVPLVVRTILKTLDESSDPSIVSDIRRECANLSPSSLAVLMEVLSTALATNPRATRLLLTSLRMATSASLLSTVDVLVLVLLFPRSSSSSGGGGVVPDLLLRCVSCHALPYPCLLRLVEYTSDAHWAVLTTPLLELCKWLLLAPLTSSSSSSRLVLLPDALAEASGWAARLLRRLFELHASPRDHILGFLLSLCINAALRKAYSAGPMGEDGEEEAGRRRQQAACLTQVMARASGVVSSLARHSPQLLLPYTGVLCDQLLNSASELEPCVMAPLLQALTRLGRAQSGSGLGMTLMIYIQKQLWATLPQPAGLRRGQEQDAAAAGGAAERRRLASLILAEALVSGRDREEGQEEDEEDLLAIVTWVLRCVPTASPMVASQGLGFLFRLLRRRRSGSKGGPTAKQVMEVTRCLNGRLGLLLPLARLPPRDARRLSYTSTTNAVEADAALPLQPSRPRPKDPGKSRMLPTTAAAGLTSAALPSPARVGDMLWPGERGPLVWAVEKAVDELLPGLLAGPGFISSSSSHPGLRGAMRLVRGVVETTLDLAREGQASSVQGGGGEAWMTEVVSAAMLMPKWRGGGQEGWQVDDAGCRGVEEEDEEEEKGSGEGGDKENEGGRQGSKGRKGRGVAEDEEQEDVFRGSGGAGSPRERVMRAGWAAVLGAVVVASLLRAVLQHSEAGGGGRRAEGPVLELVERLVDLMQRAKACLAKLDEWSRKGAAGKEQRRRGKAASAQAKDEPARICRGRLLLRRALEEELPACVAEAAGQGLLDTLLGWLEDRLAAREVEGGEEEEERRGGHPVVMLAVVMEQLGRRAPQPTGAEVEEEGEASGPAVLREGDPEVGHVCRLLRLLRPLNDLASSLRRKRARTGSASVSAWQVVALLELCLAHIRRALLQARRNDRDTAMRQAVGGAAQQQAGSSSSGGQASSSSTLPRLLGLSALATKCAQALRHPPPGPGPSTSPSAASDLEEVFLHLATLAQATESDAVASGVVELLACLTVHSQRAETGTCWQALACLTTAYPLSSHRSEHCPRLPVALSSLLRSSLGVHETPSRRLWDLYKLTTASSPSSSKAASAKPPLLLRHLVLTFWSLLPAGRRAHGVLRLVDGIRALAAAQQQQAEEEESAATAGGFKKAPPRKKKVTKKKKKREEGEGEEDEDELWSPLLPPLRCLTAESGPGLLELLLLFSLCTLVLARPTNKPTTRPAAAAAVPPPHPAGPYSEVRDALTAVAHVLRLAAHPCPALHTPHATRRIEAAAIRTATTAAAMCQWQVDRCLTWRSTRSPMDADQEGEEESAAVKHVEPLLQDAHGLAQLIARLSTRAKAAARRRRRRGGEGGGGAEAHVPKCVLSCEKLCEALREAEAMLGLGGEGGKEAGMEAALVAPGRLRAMLAVVEAEEGGAAQGRNRREEEEDDVDEDDDEEDEDSAELDESDEEEDEDEDEEAEFYALTTTLKGKRGAVQGKAGRGEGGGGGWGGGLLGEAWAEEGDDDDDDDDDAEDGGGGGLTRVVGLGGAAKYDHRVGKGGTIVVSLGAGGGSKRPRRAS